MILCIRTLCLKKNLYGNLNAPIQSQRPRRATAAARRRDFSRFFSYYSPFGYVDTLGWIDRPLSLYSLHTRVAYCCIRLTAEEWQWFPLHWRWAGDNNLLRHNLLSLMNSVLVHLHLGILNERILYLFFPLDGIERKKKHPPFNADEKFEAWKNFLKYFSSEESSFLFFLLLSK